jgi:hypothetical protein
MAYQVFISAIQRDLDLAKDLAHRLKQVGVKVFSVEKTAVAGESIETEINRALGKAACASAFHFI